MFPTRSALRLALLALACLAGLTAASGISVCPTASSTDLYVTTTFCAKYTTCLTDYCTSQGGTGFDQSTGYCTWSTLRPSCATSQNASAALMPCLNAAAADSSCNVTGLASIRLALVNLANGQFYNGSTLEKACQLHTCLLTNNSVTAADQCNLTSIGHAACVAPYVFNGILVLSGDFNAILNNATAKAQLIAALTADLQRVLGAPVTITALQGGTGLTVFFTVAVAGTNSALQSNIAAAGSSNAWLSSTQVAYNANGGTGTLTVNSITAGTQPPSTTPTTPGSGTTAPPTNTPSPGGHAAARSVFTVLAAALAVALYLTL